MVLYMYIKEKNISEGEQVGVGVRIRLQASLVWKRLIGEGFVALH